MPGRRRAVPTGGPVPVESVEHADKRINIPTADATDFVSATASEVAKVRYPRDPSLDPQLVWKGKDATDGDDLLADAPPIYIQEKIDPRVLIENLRRTGAPEPEYTLFDAFDGLDPMEKVEFYQHGANWSNRLILGDSLQVMASLAEKENLRGQVQMVYMDPPYGIKFGSNWQVSTRKRDVKDGKVEDATREVEQIKAFRDTWELGIHSYLPYLRDRLAAARDLLTESGSVFVQIGDENVHLVRSLMDEVFGSENFVSLITFKTTTGAGSFAGGTNVLASVNDYLIWYARDVSVVKYRQLYREKAAGGDGSGQYTWTEDARGKRRRGIADRGPGDRIFRADQLTSQTTRVGQTTVFPVEVDGSTYRPNKGGWKTNRAGMDRLASARRLLPLGETLTYVRYLEDFPAFSYNNLWEDTVTSGFADPKFYVVQTNTRVIERCMLMTTDPGDLVLDPTCGSGTTAYVAEQWGRRWITTDTSRVAVALARQRLMGAKLPYYLLADSAEGRSKEQELTGEVVPPATTANDVRKGFVYQRVPHVTLKSIANNPDIREGMSRAEIDAAIARHAETEVLYDKPYEDRKRVRVAGRFTVESVSPHRTATFDIEEPVPETAEQPDEDVFLRTVRDNLLAAGVQNGRKSERLVFESLDPHGHPLVQLVGERRGGGDGTPQRVAVSVGPQYGTVDGEWVKKAAREALRGQGFDLLVICGFAFDAYASGTAAEFGPGNATDFATVYDERELGRLPVLLVRMNAELAMGDAVLKKTGTANLFTMFGEPDVRIERSDVDVTVRLNGVDVYDPTTGVIRSNDTSEIAMWMIDSEYDEESFFVRHCYFSGGGTDPYQRLKRALRADIDEAAWSSVYRTVYRPFPVPKSGKIAIKVVNHYGDEVLKVVEVS